MIRYGPGLLLLVVMLGGLACGEGAAGSVDDSFVAPGESVLSRALPGEQESAGVQVAAAADLRSALPVLQATLEQECSTTITFVFGSSGLLAEQIKAGSGFHLYLSADIGYVEELARAGVSASGGSVTYTVGRIALAWRSGLEPLTSITDLTRNDIRHVAIANPGHAPYGRAARKALTAAGSWAAIEPKLVLGENVRQATDYVLTGNVDAGIVALALVHGTDASFEVIPAEMHEPLLQTGSVIKDTGGELTARCLLEALRSPASQEVFLQFGFEPLP